MVVKPVRAIAGSFRDRRNDYKASGAPVCSVVSGDGLLLSHLLRLATQKETSAARIVRVYDLDGIFKRCDPRLLWSPVVDQRAVDAGGHHDPRVTPVVRLHLMTLIPDLFLRMTSLQRP